MTTGLAAASLLGFGGLLVMGQTPADGRFRSIRAQEVIVTDSEDQQRIAIGGDQPLTGPGTIRIMAGAGYARIWMAGKRTVMDLDASSRVRADLMALEPGPFVRGSWTGIAMTGEWGNGATVTLMDDEKPRAILGSFVGGPRGPYTRAHEKTMRYPTSSLFLIDERDSTVFRAP